MGDPLDPANVPPEFWAKVEEEMMEENLTLLFLLFLASANFHAFGTYSTRGQEAGIVQTLDQQAQDYSRQRAGNVARSYTQTSVDRFDTFTQDAGEILKRDQPPGALRRFPDLDPAEKARIERGLDKVFGPSRAASIAVSETTAAQSAGGDAGARETFGISLDDKWITEADKRVCPICAPLHQTRREFWGKKYIDGPPAHVNCRCVVKYANEANRRSAA